MTTTSTSPAMDFSLSDEQREVGALAAKIFADHHGKSEASLWAALAGAGLVGTAIGEDVGGAGHGLLELCSLLIAAGGAASTAPLWEVSTAAMAIDHAGTPSQRALLRDVTRGAALITAALHEPDGGDPFSPAVMVRDSRLHGIKTCVPAADRALRLLVSARTESGEPGLYLVDPRGAGVTIETQTATTGVTHGLAAFKDAPAERVGDASTLGWLLDRAVVGLCALELGITEKVLKMTATYTSERVQFDRPIATFQAVAQRAADAYIDVETIRLTMWEAAWLLSEGRTANREIAIAKAFAADAGQRVTFAAQHLHGGIGFDLDYPLARYYPLSKWIELNLGGANAHLARLGALLAG